MATVNQTETAPVTLAGVSGKVLRDRVQAVFAKLRLACSVATTGVAFRDALEKFDFDLVLYEEDFAGLTLDEVFSIIGKKRPRPDLAVLGVRPGTGTVARAFRLGVADYLLPDEIAADGFGGRVLHLLENIAARHREQDARNAFLDAEERIKSIIRAAENISFVIVDVSQNTGVIIEVSLGAQRVLGYSPDQLLGRKIGILDLPTKLTQFSDIVGELACGAPISLGEMRLRRHNGETFPALCSAHPIFSPNGKIGAILFELLDITEHKRVQQELSELRKLHELILESAGDGIIGLDIGGTVSFINPAVTRMLGWESGELIGRKLHDTVHYARADGTAYPVDECKVNAACCSARQFMAEDEIFRRKDGTAVNVMITVTPMYDENDRHIGAVLMFQDISERIRREGKLRETALSLEKLGRIVNRSPAIAFQWRNARGWPVEFVSASVAQLGYAPTDIVGKPYWEIVYPDDLKKTIGKADESVVRGDEDFIREYRLRTRDGRIRWVEDHTWVRRGADGVIDGYDGLVLDVTGRKRVEEALREAKEFAEMLSENKSQLLRQIRDKNEELETALASEKLLQEQLNETNRQLHRASITDGLTNLYNHRHIHERLEFEFNRARRYENPLSLMMIDIDHFKTLNDTLGHQAGDRVLAEFSASLLAQSRSTDILGRYGGDEFMIVMADTDVRGATTHAEKLAKIAREKTMTIGGQPVRTSLSIGIAALDETVATRHALIERADAALYRAKLRGRDTVEVWRASDETPPDRDNSVEIFKKRFATLSVRIRKTYAETVEALLKTIDARDHYTFQHSNNVAAHVRLIAAEMGMRGRALETLCYAVLIHDIGKIAVPESVLAKSGPLSESEFALIKKHPALGIEIVEKVEFLAPQTGTILHHHERFDGTGYPDGLVGAAIPPGARIVAVADAYDSMVNNRNYRACLSPDDALGEIRRNAGSQFDPDVANTFIRLMGNGK